MPYISTEALVGAALLVVVALGYQYIPKAGDTSSGSSKASKKKNRKKNKSSGSGSGSTETRNETAATAAPASKQRDEKPEKPQPPAQNGTASPLAPASAPAPITASSKPKTLAQKIAPQPRKTKVDDMLAPEDLPGQHARVMRVASPNAPTLASAPAPALAPPVQKVGKFSDDYASSSSSESEDEPASKKKGEDDGWGVVTGKKKKPVSISFSSGAADNTSTALPLPTATKIQRKNQKKAEAKKAAKAAEEEERIRRLNMHKKQLERAKIDDLYGPGKKKAGAAHAAGPTGATSKASLDHNGKLIWD